MNLPNGSNVSLSRKGVRIVAAAGVGSAVIVGTAIDLGTRDDDPVTEETAAIVGDAFFEIPTSLTATVPSSTGPDASVAYPFGTPDPIDVSLTPLGEPMAAGAGSLDGVLMEQEYEVLLSVSSGGPALEGSVRLPWSVDSFESVSDDEPIELAAENWSQVDFIETGVPTGAACVVDDELVAGYSAMDGPENVTLRVELLPDGIVGAAISVQIPSALDQAIPGCAESLALPQLWVTDR